MSNVARIKPLRAGVWGDPTQAQRPLEARQEAVRAAWQAGQESGHRSGYTLGTRWGLFCGGLAGLAVGCALTALALRIGTWVGAL